MTAKATVGAATNRAQSDKAFDTCAHEVQAVYAANKELYGPYPFYTAGPLLFAAYVSGFKTDKLKAEVNCRACAEFIERHGRLAFITPKGEVIPAMFDHTRVSGNYRAPIKAVESIVRGSAISSLAYFDTATLGRPTDGGWQHLSIQHGVPKQQVKTDEHWAEMKIAQERHKNLTHSLASFNVTLVRRVLKFVQNESMKNGEKAEGWAKWLERIYIDMAKADVQRKNRENIIWRYVAEAPAGWCEVRGSSLGALLKNLKDGMDDDDAIAIYDDITRADKHQRPTAAPTEGNINQAERLIEAMGLARSLQRRFCGISEFPHIWDPKPVEAASEEGVFGGLRSKAKGKKATVHSAVPTTEATQMTWAKFAKKILPDALSMTMYIPHGKQGFGSFLTAVNPDAPPLLKWDTDLDNPNPVSSYVHTKGSLASQWSLTAGTYVPVLALAVMPWMLNPHVKGMGEGVMLVLEGAQDSDVDSLALFPNDLLSALHQVRATIEAFSNDGKLQECVEDQALAGYMINNKATPNAKLRVTTSLGVSDFIIDRWE